MTLMVIRSWLLLLHCDGIMRLGGFERLQAAVRRSKARRTARVLDRQRLSRSIDFACVFYFKRVLCLQRSAATTILLRRHGWNAELVIGAQLLPFQSHAWVESEGSVINDKPYVKDIFQELDRC